MVIVEIVGLEVSDFGMGSESVMESGGLLKKSSWADGIDGGA